MNIKHHDICAVLLYVYPPCLPHNLKRQHHDIARSTCPEVCLKVTTGPPMRFQILKLYTPVDPFVARTSRQWLLSLNGSFTVVLMLFWNVLIGSLAHLCILVGSYIEKRRAKLFHWISFAVACNWVSLFSFRSLFIKWSCSCADFPKSCSMSYKIP